MRTLAPILLFALVLAGCTSPVTPGSTTTPAVHVEPDPATPEEIATLLSAETATVEKLAYDFGLMVATRGDLVAPYPVRLRGSVHLPVTGDALPVVLLMHGNHGTCSGTGATFPSAYCGAAPIPGQKPVPSFAGYDYLSEPLAAQGYFVVSIDANDVNDGNALDFYAAGRPERGQLVLRTLEELEKRNASGGEFEGRLDLTRVGLMGHSRGGEGVVEAIRQNAARAAPFGIRAVIALAPTDFASLDVRDTPFLTILPSCDGDVVTLHGARQYDASRYIGGNEASLYQALTMGANHNFYNTEWTFDDGTNSDPYCGDDEPTRPTPEEQREGGALLMNGFFRHHLGGEPTWRGILTGDQPLPATACASQGAPDCRAGVHMSFHPGASTRQTLYAPEALTENALGGSVAFTGFDASLCESGQRAQGFVGIVANLVPRDSEHLDCPMWVPGRAVQTTLAWKAPDAKATFDIPADARDVSRWTHLSLRVGVDYLQTKADNVTLHVTLTDAKGKRAEADAGAWSGALFTPPGETWRETVLNGVRVPLRAFEGVDVTQLASVELTVHAPSKGRMQIADVMFV